MSECQKITKIALLFDRYKVTKNKAIRSNQTGMKKKTPQSGVFYIVLIVSKLLNHIKKLDFEDQSHVRFNRSTGPWIGAVSEFTRDKEPVF